jgi:hypothetical protein
MWWSGRGCDDLMVYPDLSWGTVLHSVWWRYCCICEAWHVVEVYVSVAVSRCWVLGRSGRGEMCATVQVEATRSTCSRRNCSNTRTMWTKSSCLPTGMPTIQFVVALFSCSQLFNSFITTLCVCVCVCSYDVILLSGVDKILEHFVHFEARVVFSAEGFCWPDEGLASKYPSVQRGKRYLNSGGMGSVSSQTYVFNCVCLF